MDISRERTPVFVGAVVTVVLTIAVFIGAQLLFGSFQTALFDTTGDYVTRNPFQNLHYFIGLIGGYLAGYLTGGQWYRGATNGLRATILGVVGIYLTMVTYQLVVALTSGGAVAVYLIVSVPMLLLLPLAITFLIQGAIGGSIGAWMRLT